MILDTNAISALAAGHSPIIEVICEVQDVHV